MNPREEYVLLKYIELIWSTRREVPSSLRGVLSRYGVKNLVDLDRIIHRLHLKVSRSRDSCRRASGDVEYIEYLLETLFQSHIISSRGDGVTEPGYLETRYLNVVVKILSEYSAELGIETDYEAGVLEFADACLEDFKDDYFSMDVKVMVDGRNIRLVTDAPDLLVNVLDFLGDALMVKEVVVGDGEVTLIGVDDVDEAVALIRETYNSFIAYESFLETDKTLYKPVYLERAVSGLETFKSLLSGVAVIEYNVDDVASVHLHGDTVHVHGRIKVKVETSIEKILPLLIAGVIACIDMNATYETKYFVANAERTAEITKKLVELAMRKTSLDSETPASVKRTRITHTLQTIQYSMV